MKSPIFFILLQNNQFILALDMIFRPALVKAINLVMSMSQTTQPSTNDIDTRDDGTVVTLVTTVSTAISLSPVTTQVYARSTDNSSDTQYVMDDIWYAGLPRNSDGVLQLSIFIAKDGKVFSNFYQVYMFIPGVYQECIHYL